MILHILEVIKFVIQVTQVQSHLLAIQPEFKANLLTGVEKFVVDTDDFTGDYNVR